MKVWDAERSSDTFTLRGHASYVNSLAISPDGKRIISGGYETTVKIWEAAPEAKPRRSGWNKTRLRERSFVAESERIARPKRSLSADIRQRVK